MVHRAFGDTVTGQARRVAILEVEEYRSSPPSTLRPPPGVGRTLSVCDARSHSARASAGLTHSEGAMTEARYDELSEGMRVADDDPLTLVAHARMHQLVARKPEPPR